MTYWVFGKKKNKRQERKSECKKIRWKQKKMSEEKEWKFYTILSMSITKKGGAGEGGQNKEGKEWNKKKKKFVDNENMIKSLWK